MNSKQRRAAALRAKRVSDHQIPDLARPIARKGKAPQRVGMWGNISTDYRTAATHDIRWSQTVSNAS